MRPMTRTYELGQLRIELLRAEADSREIRLRSAELRRNWRIDSRCAQVPELRTASIVERTNLLTELLQSELVGYRKMTEVVEGIVHMNRQRLATGSPIALPSDSPRRL